MRVYNVTVFDDWVAGTTEVFSDPQFNEILGRANQVHVEIWVKNSAGSTPKVTIKFYTSNGNLNFNQVSIIASAVDVTTTPVLLTGAAGGANMIGAFGRLGFVMDTSSNKAHIKVTVAGHTN